MTRTFQTPASPTPALTRRSLVLAGTGALAALAAVRAPAAHAAPSEACWTTPGLLPHAVQEIYPCLHKSRIHISGGLLAENGAIVGVSPWHMALSPETGQTAILASSPARRHHPQLADAGGRLFQLGGFRGGDDGSVAWTATADTLLYNDQARAWETRASAPAPHAECVAATIDGRIHLAGGRTPKGAANLAYGDQADTVQHLVYDPGVDAWQSAAPALTARNSAAGAMIGGLWHVVAGRSMSGGNSDAHEVYDPKEDTWRTAAPMPTGSGAGGVAAGVIGGDLYVFGGEYFDPRPGGVHPEVWRYVSAADRWETVSEMPTPRHGLGGVAVNDAIYLVGGARRPSGSDTSDLVERFALKC
ncbi:MAG: kelch repeat-containing protein [Hyphomonadaceae bacterium]